MVNEFERKRLLAEEYRKSHPPGTRLMLLSTTETLQPIPIGTKGTVDHVDAQAQIHMKWDNGRTLAILPEEDTFRKLTEAELELEKQSQGKEVAFADDCSVIVPDKAIDCSKLGFFDEIEYDCWHLVEKYAELLGIKLIQSPLDDEPISFDVAKAVQDCILEQFEKVGVQFNFENEEEQRIVNLNRKRRR